MMRREYETASGRWPQLEYGTGGFVTHIDSKRIAAPYSVKCVDDGKVLQGLACVYNVPVIVDGHVKMICPGAFDDYLANPRNKVGFWLNHDPEKVVGDTDNGLELFSDRRGLAFRFRFPDNSMGRLAKEIAQSKEYTGMSVGCTYQNDNVVTMEGIEVSQIKNAHLQEISFVKAGAIEKAFGILGNADISLKEACNTALSSDGAFVRLMRATQALQQNLATE
jgi:HK97 family phage prohead protease